MTTHIVFLRSVNVGGRNKLYSNGFADTITSLGGANVQTYVQSGNAVFSGQVQAEKIADEIENRFGFKPIVFLLSARDLKEIVAENPYKDEAEVDPKSVHGIFLAGAAERGLSRRFNDIKTDEERFEIGKSVVYLHAPAGFSKSNIAKKIDSIVGVPTTARNWRTISAVIKLCEQGGENGR
ncbi:MAG: DUF1697 domain-containing protein [Pseudomonadota bacterium]